jgi:hypothetical protein
MKPNYSLAVTAICLLLLSGCGAPPPAVKVTKPATPPPAPSKPGLGLSQAELLKGMEPITLERVEQGGPPAYLGYTPDREESGNKFASLIAYGQPEAVTRAFFSAAMPVDEYPDPAKYPDFMVRNQKLLDNFLNNIFQGKVPADVHSQIEFAEKNPNKKRVVNLTNSAIYIEYDDTKRLTIDMH